MVVVKAIHLEESICRIKLVTNRGAQPVSYPNEWRTLRIFKNSDAGDGPVNVVNKRFVVTQCWTVPCAGDATTQPCRYRLRRHQAQVCRERDQTQFPITK